MKKLIYILAGEDTLAKDVQTENIKKDVLSADSHSFNYEVLHATKLSPADLKKSLLTLPAGGSKRLVLIREAQKLNEQNQDIVSSVMLSGITHLILILDFSELPKNAFIKKIQSSAEMIEFGTIKKLNVFDMTRAIEMRRESDALKLLDQLITTGNHPLQLLGGLVWFWGKMRGKISRTEFEKGLLAIQEADLNIKRSRLKPEYALELLIVKLCWQEVC